MSYIIFYVNTNMSYIILILYTAYAWFEIDHTFIAESAININIIIIMIFL